MGYRGEDLDLRTSQNWGAVANDPISSAESSATTNGQRSGYRYAPILVDDTLLACCNHAFEIALAHRSGDVRVEHLLHALTRIDGAVEALEVRGVRAAALRRESATIIASEIPVGLANGKGAPRRSDEFAEVLRLAAMHAARRGDPAGVDDLVFILLEQRPELAGAGLLARHAPRLLPPREIIDQPSRFGDLRYATSSNDRYYRMEPTRYVTDSPRAYRAEFLGAQTDAVQNSRIEALEDLVRALSADLASERQTLSALLKDLSRTANAQRDGQDRLQADLFDRLQTIEQVVGQSRGGDSGEAVGERLAGFEVTLDRRVQDMALSWSTFAARLQGLEDAVRQFEGAGASDLTERLQQAIDLRPLISRLDIIEEAVLGRDFSGADAPANFQLIEKAVSRIDVAVAEFERRSLAFDTASIANASGPASSIVGETQTFSELASELGDRMSAVERALTGEIETAVVKHQAHAHDLTELHEALLKLNQNQHTLAGSIDAWRTDAAGDIAMIANRLANLDRDNERPIETLNALSDHMDTMNRMFIERYHRRNRFWYWLFGTDDWLGRSWPSQSAAMVADAERSKAPDAL